MKFIKNVLKLIICCGLFIMSAAMFIPSEFTVRYVWSVMIPFYILVIAYCKTYDVSPETLMDKFWKL